MSAAKPSNIALEEALRDAVTATFTSGKTEELTVKRLRTLVEQQLGLEQGFFKADEIWSAKSKNIIQDAVDEHEEDIRGSQDLAQGKAADAVQEKSSAKKGAKRSSPADSEGTRKRAKLSPKLEAPAQPPKNTTNTKNNTSLQKGVKRSSPDVSEGPRKRKESSQSAESTPEPSSAPKPQRKAKPETSGSELSEPPSEVEAPPPEPTKSSKLAKTKQNGLKRNTETKKVKVVKGRADGIQEAGGDDEDAEKPNGTSIAESKPKVSTKDDVPDDSSELSSLIDEELAPKKKGRKRTSSPKSTKSKKVAKQAKPRKPKASATPTTTTDLPADEVEIKRLQSWLIKCGIRKMWHRELAPYSSPSAKVAHLKRMLKDAGMDGRFSVEKARAIKERRELEQDLEAVKEGDKRWGNRNEDSQSEGEGKQESGENGEEKPKRRLAKSLQGLDFLNDDDGEETD
ncbi:MAG: hypothetical protein Q9165_006404 [Trypethelium subeluteriae]